MSEKRYILIMPDEDGNPIRYLDNEEINDINQLMEDYGVTEWVESYDDPNYWREGQGMLIKWEKATPIPFTKVATWILPTQPDDQLPDKQEV